MITALILILLQAAPATVAPPLIIPPKDVGDRTALKALGDVMEYSGHCSRFLPSRVMDELLVLASAQPVDEPYLMSRIGAGSKRPKDQTWCKAHQPR